MRDLPLQDRTEQHSYIVTIIFQVETKEKAQPLPWHCGTAGESMAPPLASSGGTHRTGFASAAPALTQGERTSPTREQREVCEKAGPPGRSANQRKAWEKCHRDGFGFILSFILGGITACGRDKTLVM